MLANLSTFWNWSCVYISVLPLQPPYFSFAFFRVCLCSRDSGFGLLLFCYNLPAYIIDSHGAQCNYIYEY